MIVHLLLLVLAAAVGVDSCKLHAFTVGPPSNPANMSVPYYTPHEMEEVVHGLGAYTKGYHNPTTTTFACVDSRGNTPRTLETPGGDISELAALIVAYHRAKGTTPAWKSVNRIFRKFMEVVATPDRPFYFHTSDEKLHTVFTFYQNLTGEDTVAIPHRQPENQTQAAAWLDALSQPSAQGCGHVRLTLQEPDAYGLNTTEEKAVMVQLIKAFFLYWWPTPEFSYQRERVIYPVLQGTLAGKALAIINNVGPACLGKEPDIMPFHSGTTIFTYQPNAVTTFREETLINLIAAYDYTVNTDDVLAELTALQATQLGAVLRLLSPVNQLPIYTINVSTTA